MVIISTVQKQRRERALDYLDKKGFSVLRDTVDDVLGDESFGDLVFAERRESNLQSLEVIFLKTSVLALSTIDTATQEPCVGQWSGSNHCHCTCVIQWDYHPISLHEVTDGTRTQKHRAYLICNAPCSLSTNALLMYNAYSYLSI